MAVTTAAQSDGRLGHGSVVLSAGGLDAKMAVEKDEKLAVW